MVQEGAGKRTRSRMPTAFPKAESLLELTPLGGTKVSFYEKTTQKRRLRSPALYKIVERNIDHNIVDSHTNL